MKYNIGFIKIKAKDYKIVLTKSKCLYIIKNISICYYKNGGDILRIDRVKFVSEITRKSMTLKVLAEKAGVSRQTLSSIKNGKSCTDSVGEKIANALSVDVTELIED